MLALSACYLEFNFGKQKRIYFCSFQACKLIMIKTFHSLMRCSSSNPIDLNPPDDDSPCSGRGDCLNGTCLCEIRYSGDECTGFNLPYHAGKCEMNKLRNLEK